MPLRVGRVEFLNCDPLFHDLESQLSGDYQIVSGNPRALTAQMLSADVDLAPIPAHDLIKQRDQFVAIPGLCISSPGRVGSVGLMSRSIDFSFERNRSYRVALPSDSATSASLVRWMLASDGIDVEYTEMPPDLDSMLEDHDLALLIGDRALLAAREKPKQLVWDLAEEWVERTRTPMVFALFALRRELVDHPGIAGVVEVLVERARGHPANLTGLVSAQPLSLADDVVESYLRGLLFYLDAAALQGFQTYRSRVLGEETDIDWWRASIPTA